ncbi:MAG: mycofactocin glycosyltransferase, partial [Pseudonocardiales bacterium]|nr:mycofactocin glycosyltransferase [Pseudonocardiales bacterium]
MTDTRLPDGFAVRLDRRTRRLDGGAALLGLSSGRLLHLAPAARRLLDAGACPGCADLVVRDATSARLARRLLDAGIAHPALLDLGVPAGPGPADVTVVVPVKDRPDGLRRLLAALALAPATPALATPAPATLAPAMPALALAEVIVVDDGSADP